MIQDLIALNPACAGDSPSGREIESAEEHGKLAEQGAFGFGEQRVRPIDRGAQRLLTAHRRARTTGQQAEAVVQAVDEVGQ